MKGTRMRERGLLLSKNLRAKARSGEKTQTRRLVKLDLPNCFKYTIHGGELVADHRDEEYGEDVPFSRLASWNYPTPQYQVGDHLYLCEPYQISRGLGLTCRVSVEYLDNDKCCHVELTKAEYKKWDDRKFPFRKTSSRFMYKSLARTWFEVTDVRVERLQEISLLDIKAEGIFITGRGYTKRTFDKWIELWDSASKIKWADNPWVFCYTFKRIEK
jgi:hypothetical protein